MPRTLNSLKLRKFIAEVRLSETVYETLLEAILTCRLSPGEAIGEQALARHMGVSRTPVHDAVRQLISDGLVTQRPNHRPVVASVTADDLEEIFDMRALLEGEAAFLAAKRIDRSLLGELRAAGEALASVTDGKAGVQRWADFDEEFHSQIGLASGNRRLSRDISRYRQLLRGLNKQHTDMAVLQPALAEHLQILDALSRRDADAARRAMLEHIHEWKAFFVRKFF
jgi:GntR family transcriptional regulator, rspAB operon transcriptional repressor